jgi:plastocyanin
VIRRAAIAATLLFVLSTSGAAAATRTIEVKNNFYDPATTKVKLGTTVLWHNATAATTHTSTADLFGLWNEGISGGTTSDPIIFKQSGSFAYHCTIHASMHGKVNVRMRATPTTGTLSTTYVIRFATINAPAGFVYDVQRRKHGGTYSAWISTTAQTLNFTAPSKGRWEFHSRLRRTSDNLATGYSPMLTVTVE